jgi:putative transposase
VTLEADFPVYKLSRTERRPLRLADWPRVDERALSEPARSTFRARRQAVEQYAAGQALAPIESASGVHRATLLRLIARALRPHPDARLWGYRALVPNARVRPYERSAAPRVLVNAKAGNAGAFAQLLQRHPSLAAQLRAEVTSGRVWLRPGGARGYMVGLKAAIARFHHTCRELGLSGADYPLNQHDKAVRSTARVLRAWLDDDIAVSARASGTRLKPASALRQTTRAVLDAFDTVEFDAHKLDLRLKVILEQDPLGGEHSLEIERLWLLAVIDVATRCMLGWTLAFGRECDRFDAIETVKRALVPAAAPELTLPGLHLMPSGGFVSQALPQTRFACWRQIRLDNARAHLATTSLDVLCETLGCTADFGPAYEPDDRPFIERFFGTLSATLSRRLPGAIPARSRQEQVKALARSSTGKNPLRLVVTAQELQELLELAIWNYHGTPHASLGGLTPLEMMQRHVLGIGRGAIRLRLLPQQLREQPALLHDPVACRVRGQVARGERPYITYLHVRYTSAQLSRRVGLVGQSLRVHADPQDLRQLVVTTASGEILEPLLASGAWREHRHSRWLRRAFFKAKRMRQLAFSEGEDPIEAFLALRRKQAGKSKRASTDVARIQHEGGRRPKDSVPAPISAQPSPAVPASPPLSNLPGLADAPAKGRSLRIMRGFAR